MVSLAKGIKSLEDVEKKYKDLAKVNKNLPPFEEFIEKSLISQENNKQNDQSVVTNGTLLFLQKGAELHIGYQSRDFTS